MKINWWASVVLGEFDARRLPGLRDAIEHGIERRSLKLLGHVLAKVFAVDRQGGIEKEGQVGHRNWRTGPLG
jgi:hypothetical protein